MRNLHAFALLIFSIAAIDIESCHAADPEPPASPEVKAAMQPYLDGYKLAGVVALIADKAGKVHYPTSGFCKSASSSRSE